MKNRIEQQKKQKQKTKTKDQRNRNKYQKNTKQPEPKSQWQESSQSRCRTGNNRNRYLSCAIFGCIYIGIPLLNIPINIFYDNDRIVHQHPQSQYQGKQYHHIECHTREEKPKNSGEHR